MNRVAAQAALERRIAVVALAGNELGSLPLLWLIREALDAYWDTCRDTLKLAGAQEKRLLRGETRLLRVGGHVLFLAPWNAPRILVEHDAFGSTIRSHEVPSAVLVLHGAVREAPVRSERLLVAIERATKGMRAMTKKCSRCRTMISAADWSLLRLVGYQEDGDGGFLELRNCTCGTTLCVQAAGRPGRPSSSP